MTKTMKIILDTARTEGSALLNGGQQMNAGYRLEARGLGTVQSDGVQIVWTRNHRKSFRVSGRFIPHTTGETK